MLIFFTPDVATSIPERSQFRIQPGTVANPTGSLSDNARAALYGRYNQVAKIYYPLERQIPKDAHTLNSYAQFYDYALLDGRRITPLSRSLRNSAGSSIIQSIWNDAIHAGEVLNIFHHPQKGIAESILFAEIRWMKKLDLCPMASSQNNFPWEIL
jgi:hypothetical protein